MAGYKLHDFSDYVDPPELDEQIRLFADLLYNQRQDYANQIGGGGAFDSGVILDAPVNLSQILPTGSWHWDPQTLDADTEYNIGSSIPTGYVGVLLGYKFYSKTATYGKLRIGTRPFVGGLDGGSAQGSTGSVMRLLLDEGEQFTQRHVSGGVGTTTAYSYVSMALLRKSELASNPETVVFLRPDTITLAAGALHTLYAPTGSQVADIYNAIPLSCVAHESGLAIPNLVLRVRRTADSAIYWTSPPFSPSSVSPAMCVPTDTAYTQEGASVPPLLNSSLVYEIQNTSGSSTTFNFWGHVIVN